jgi:hypothetical protein
MLDPRSLYTCLLEFTYQQSIVNILLFLFSAWIGLCKKKKLPCSDEEKYSLADTLGEPIKIQVNIFD